MRYEKLVRVVAPPLTVLGLLLAAGLVQPAAAQPWRGTAGLEVEITQKGKPVGGAEVRLVFLDADPKAGPGEIVSTASGVVTATGLAEGKWRIEVRYAGKSPYSAVIQVAAGGRAEVVAGPVRDAAAPPLNVRFQKPRQPSVPAPPPAAPIAPAPSPKPPEARTPEPQTPEHKAGEPRTPEPAPTPAPTPAPSAAVEKPAPPKPSPAPAPAPAAPPRPAAPAPAAPAPAPAAPATPAPATPSRVAGFPRSAEDGSCPECKPGELAISVQAAAGAGSATAPCNADADAGRAIQLLQESAPPEAGRYLGPLADPVSGGLAGVYGPVAAAGVRLLLAPYLTPAGPCQLLAVALPAGSRYTGYAYEASDSATAGACVGANECEIGKARWAGHPVVEKTRIGIFVYGIFTNGSADRERRARLTVYFVPGPVKP